ncbi:hypothetical protein L596_010568 [Steinernema carpocapsae]|uniref:Uncharacterized protein n=1 Tax=Steinernema carpocapsae TaxID=34508 RepID=A0A4U5PIP0_STECR|nr:hypothetical protein L596_010568 [Steinernema carpocapsae]
MTLATDCGLAPQRVNCKQCRRRWNNNRCRVAIRFVIRIQIFGLIWVPVLSMECRLWKHSEKRHLKL